LIAIRNNIKQHLPIRKYLHGKTKTRNGKDNGREYVKIPTRPFKFSFQKKAIF
jgi:hypothetical protein